MGVFRPSRVVAAAAAGSVAMHVSMGWLAGGMGVLVEPEAGGRTGQGVGAPMLLAWADEPPLPEPFEAEPERSESMPPEEELVRLGIADSDHETDNWMGFADPTPHAAAKSAVDQPALDPLAGDAANPGTSGDTAGQAAPLTSPAPPTPDRAAPATAARAVEDVGEAEAEAAAREALAGDAEKSRTQRGNDAAEESREAVDDPTLPMEAAGEPEGDWELAELSEAFVGPPREAAGRAPAVAHEETAAAEPARVEPAAPAPIAQPEPMRTSPMASSDGGSAAPGLRPGEASDRESDAASREESVVIRPGRPAAAKGLEIVTRRPEFSRLTRVTANPERNPRLRVTFGRDGRVSQARFLEATGLEDVDSPVLNAVYRWTARGEALAKLPSHDPTAGVTVTVTILLR